MVGEGVGDNCSGETEGSIGNGAGDDGGGRGCKCLAITDSLSWGPDFMAGYATLRIATEASVDGGGAMAPDWPSREGWPGRTKGWAGKLSFLCVRGREAWELCRSSLDCT
jgi:hypothetical protein